MAIENPDQVYSAAMDSVGLLNGGRPDGYNEAQWAECEARNVAHIQIVLGYEWPPGYDLQPLIDAVS